MCGALFGNPAFQPLPLDVAMVGLAHGARPNDDPLDALIAAAARSLELPLITRDGDLRGWAALKTVW